jgi:hypothetical protein
MGKVRKLNESPLAHCWAGVLHSPETNKMRNRVASYGKGTGNDTSLAEAKKKRSPLNQTDPYKKLTSKFPQFNQATDTVVSGSKFCKKEKLVCSWKSRVKFKRSKFRQR